MRLQRVINWGMLTGLLCALLGGMISPAMAQPTLYDDFSEPLIDPSLWTTSVIGGATVFELTRAVERRQLTLGIRGYARTDRDTDIHEHRNQLGFVQGDFGAIQFEAGIKSYDLTGCSVPGSTIGLVIVQLQLVLFNDGSRTSSSDRTGDVVAYLRMYRSSDSTAPPNVVEVIGQLTRCGNSACSQETALGVVSLGSMLVGHTSTFLVIWDFLNSRVLYYKDNGPEMSIAYTQPPITLSLIRNLAAYTVVPNCTAVPRPTSEVTAVFDNISVLFFAF